MRQFKVGDLIKVTSILSSSHKSFYLFKIDKIDGNKIYTYKYFSKNYDNYQRFITKNNELMYVADKEIFSSKFISWSFMTPKDKQKYVRECKNYQNNLLKQV